MSGKNIKIENIIKLLKKNFNEYSICKINDYFLLKNIYKNDYLKINSNYQIRNIYKIYLRNHDHLLVQRLLDVILKYKKVKRIFKFIRQIHQKTDYEIFEQIRKIWKNNQSGGSNLCFSNNLWAEEIIFHIKKNNIKPKNYLDVGCGSGKLTVLIGNKLNLNKENIFGIDIESFHEKGDWDRKKLEFIFKLVKVGKKLPFKNNTFDLVSTFMVLHHIEDLDFQLKEINRIIKKNGYLVIREHDCVTHVDKMLCDLEHYMYFHLNSEKMNNNISKNFQNDYKAYYYDIFEWDYFMDKYGFKFVYGSYISKDIYNQITPTRSFIRIYQKI